MKQEEKLFVVRGGVIVCVGWVGGGGGGVGNGGYII